MKRIAAIALLLLSSPLLAESVETSEYVRRLVSIRALVSSRRIPEARIEARRLDGARIEGARESFSADRSILMPLIRADAKLSIPAEIRRLDSTIDALRAAERGSGVQPDRALLDRIRRTEESERLASGGAHSQLPATRPGPMEELYDWTAKIVHAIGNALEWLFEFLISLWPHGSESLKRNSGVSLTVGAIVAVTLLVLGFLAIEIVRRSRKRAPEPLEPGHEIHRGARDSDPLSREADDWERYALELARAERLREAIRAWYHAVLVALYRAGVVHYRKGRTNWEYVAAVPPGMIWRADLASITRTFERAWYGRDESTHEITDGVGRTARSILAAVHRERSGE